MHGPKGFAALYAMRRTERTMMVFCLIFFQKAILCGFDRTAPCGFAHSAEERERAEGRAMAEMRKPISPGWRGEALRDGHEC